MTEVSVKSLALDRASKTPVVILREVGSDRVLPIWIGPREASSIAMQMGGYSFQRPLTHDLLAAVVRGMGGSLERVLITRVEDSTYFAEMIIDRGGSLISVDARPSDSIALALRLEARIFADDSLLAKAERSVEIVESEETGDPESRMSVEKLAEHLRSLRPEDLGRFEG